MKNGHHVHAKTHVNVQTEKHVSSNPKNINAKIVMLHAFVDTKIFAIKLKKRKKLVFVAFLQGVPVSIKTLAFTPTK